MTNARPQPPARPATKGYALDGIRVTDFTWWHAGAQATVLLAEFGAEVIKIESLKPHASRSIGGQFGPGVGGAWAVEYHSKMSVTLNMQDQRGKEKAKELIAISDVVIENFTPKVLPSWGLSYPEMRKLRPDIIYISMPGTGRKGPYSSYRTLGPIVQALSGLTYLGGLPGEEPSGWGFSYMDHTSGYYAAMAAIQAIYHRRKTGQGQWVDLSQIFCAATLTGPSLLDYAVNKRKSYVVGNRSKYQPAAPYGAYPCQGKDRWCAISIMDDAQWQALCALMGNPSWAKDAKFATSASRAKNQDELDAVIGEWTGQFDRYDLMERLQTAGIPAGVVQNGEDRVERDPQFKHRGLFAPLAHPMMGTGLVPNLPVQFTKQKAGPLYSSTPMREFNEEVFTRILGMPQAKFADYEKAGVI
jgi:crotonobetainyl-CoA:carnitine CoA-transferase CaiB-like acyl-CoA transferase